MKFISATFFSFFGAAIIGGAFASQDADTERALQTSTGTESWMECQFDLAKSMTLDKDGALTFYHYVALAPEGDSRVGILCGRVEQTDAEGWIGFGNSPTGEMEGGIGIVGIPGDGTVEKYYLGDGEIERLPDEKQTLMFASITQDDVGTTIMEFAKFLEEEDELPILANGDNIFLFALGASNQLGYHPGGEGSFTLDLEATASTSSTAVSVSTSATSTASSSTISIGCKYMSA